MIFNLRSVRSYSNGKNAFDRVVLDKKIDSREAYFRSLNKQVIALEDLDAKIKKAWVSFEAAKNETQRKRSLTRFKNYEGELAPIFKKCCLKNSKYLRISFSK